MTHDLQVDITQAEQESREHNQQERGGRSVAEKLAFLNIVLHGPAGRSWNVPSEIHE